MVLKNGNIYADDDSVNTPNKLFLTCSAMIFFRISKKFKNLKSHCTDPDETFVIQSKIFFFLVMWESADPSFTQNIT